MEFQRIIHLCLIGSGLLLSGCERDQGVALSDLEERVSELESSFAGVKRTASQLRRELAQVSDVRTKVEDEADAARTAVAQILTERNALVASFETYRVDYHDSIIKRAVGMNLGDVAIGPVTYHNARVKSLDAWEVSLHHNNGITRVDLVNLPENLKSLLGYDPSVGPKPTPDLAIGGLVAPPVSAASGSASTEPESGATRPRFAPVAIPNREAECTNSSSEGGRSAYTTARDSGSEVLVRFQGVGMNGMSSGSSGGTPVKGGVSEVPQGYKPIGSSFSGSAMDRDYRKKK